MEATFVATEAFDVTVFLGSGHPTEVTFETVDATNFIFLDAVVIATSFFSRNVIFLIGLAGVAWAVGELCSRGRGSSRPSWGR